MMKTLKHLAGWLALALACTLPGEALAAGGFSFDTSFTHQGRLRFEGKPANGLYDFQFKLYTNLVSGGQLGITTNYTNIPASNGLYRVDLDFGDVFLGGPRFIETSVQSATNRIGFQTLSPRQPVTAVPYALWARRGGSEVWTTRFFEIYSSSFYFDDEPFLPMRNQVSAGKIIPLFPTTTISSKKVESISILVSLPCYLGSSVFLQAEIRSVTGPVRQVLMTAPIDCCSLPLKQWQTLTLDPAANAVVRPGEYLCLRAITTSPYSVETYMVAQATVHDAE